MNEQKQNKNSYQVGAFDPKECSEHLRKEQQELTKPLTEQVHLFKLRSEESPEQLAHRMYLDYLKWGKEPQPKEQSQKKRVFQIVGYPKPKE
jgi:hypothetical protein